MLYKKKGVTKILQLSQRNGKLTLPWQEQSNYLVITIYGAETTNSSLLFPFHQNDHQVINHSNNILQGIPPLGPYLTLGLTLSRIR